MVSYPRKDMLRQTPLPKSETRVGLQRPGICRETSATYRGTQSPEAIICVLHLAIHPKQNPRAAVVNVGSTCDLHRVAPNLARFPKVRTLVCGVARVESLHQIGCPNQGSLIRAVPLLLRRADKGIQRRVHRVQEHRVLRCSVYPLLVLFRNCARTAHAVHFAPRTNFCIKNGLFFRIITISMFTFTD